MSYTRGSAPQIGWVHFDTMSLNVKHISSVRKLKDEKRSNIIMINGKEFNIGIPYGELKNMLNGK